MSAGFSLAGEVVRSQGPYEEALKCGPNSLFVFLLLSGHKDISWADMQTMPVSSNGVSLLALSDFAESRFHTKTEIRRYRLDEIEAVPLPAVAQFKNQAATLTPFHFGVIYKVDRRRIYLIDGSSGLKRFMWRSRLPDFWTGVALSEVRTSSTPIGSGIPLHWPAALLALDAVIVALVLSRFTKTQACLVPNSVSIARREA
jgi:ABC-type bacteriocin/lantibiotic exporter with double-glycine peptidase domain